ncbi:unnamed protein product [Oreochromis niloticus]|nr:unnamed protein product [Mustela putorius furo]
MWTCTDDIEGKKIYPVTEYSRSNSIALLISNIHFNNPRLNLHGADAHAMGNLLNYLGYEAIDDKIISFSKHRKLFNTDSVFVVIMSHGNLGTICGSDNQNFEIDHIYERLNTKNCPALMNKPKVIIIQACRGGNEGIVDISGSTQLRARENSYPLKNNNGGKAHIEKDFIGFYSTTPYTTAFGKLGSVSDFIKHICDVIFARCHQDDIEELFKKVMQRFEDSPSELKQMPTRETLTKHFYLFPGSAI